MYISILYRNCPFWTLSDMSNNDVSKMVEIDTAWSYSDGIQCWKKVWKNCFWALPISQVFIVSIFIDTYSIGNGK